MKLAPASDLSNHPLRYESRPFFLLTFFLCFSCSSSLIFICFPFFLLFFVYLSVYHGHHQSSSFPPPLFRLPLRQLPTTAPPQVIPSSILFIQSGRWVPPSVPKPPSVSASPSFYVIRNYVVRNTGRSAGVFLPLLLYVALALGSLRDLPLVRNNAPTSLLKVAESPCPSL